MLGVSSVDFRAQNRKVVKNATEFKMVVHTDFWQHLYRIFRKYSTRCARIRNFHDIHENFNVSKN